MRSKLSIAAAAIFVAALYGVSLAGGAEPSPHADAIVSAPVVPLAESEQLDLKNSIGEPLWERVGLRSSALINARHLTMTPAGPLIAVLGERGLCLSLAGASSCGDPSIPGEFVSLFVRDPESGNLVGGGVGHNEWTGVTLRAGSRAHRMPTRGGLFVLRASAGVLPSREIRFDHS